MKTLTVEEATSGLDKLVGLALAGEQIQIRNGEGVVELRPAQSQTPTGEHQTPREALRHLQQNTRLTSDQAEAYLRDVRDERLASDGKLPG